MAVATFTKLATTIASNAHNYASRRACELAIGRVKHAWTASGSYGVYKDYMTEAVTACQLRWLELRP